MRVFITGGTACRSLISNNGVTTAGGTLQVLNNAEFNRQLVVVYGTNRPGISACFSRIYGGAASVHVTTPAAIFPGAGYCPCAAGTSVLQGAFSSETVGAPFPGFYQTEYRPAWAGVRVAPDCPGGFNNDRAVNTGDLVLFLSEFGSFYFLPSDPIDMNFDGAVNTTDLTMFLARFGATCP